MTEQERLACLETTVKAHDEQIISIGKDVKEIKEKLLGRPSWQITTIISTLTGACGVMATYIITSI
jgi:hypothetical protein